MAGVADLFDDHQAQELLRLMVDHLVPGLVRSTVVAHTVPEGLDARSALELGLAIMMDKPIIVMVPEGRTVPSGLARLAMGAVDMDLKDPQRSADALAYLVGQVAEEPDDQ